tara:strand:+ start:320 stop:472 length:153 start_codon:yes stop_codon:yes gene_type:complete
LFLCSAEFTENDRNNISDEKYVKNRYKNFLGRDADTEGLFNPQKWNLNPL